MLIVNSDSGRSGPGQHRVFLDLNAAVGIGTGVGFVLGLGDVVNCLCFRIDCGGVTSNDDLEDETSVKGIITRGVEGFHELRVGLVERNSSSMCSGYGPAETTCNFPEELRISVFTFVRSDPTWMKIHGSLNLTSFTSLTYRSGNELTCSSVTTGLSLSISVFKEQYLLLEIRFLLSFIMFVNKLESGLPLFLISVEAYAWKVSLRRRRMACLFDWCGGVGLLGVARFVAGACLHFLEWCDEQRIRRQCMLVLLASNDYYYGKRNQGIEEELLFLWVLQIVCGLAFGVEKNVWIPLKLNLSQLALHKSFCQALVEQALVLPNGAVSDDSKQELRIFKTCVYVSRAPRVFYDQAPESMRSTATALFWMAIAAGNYGSTLLVTMVHKMSTGQDGSNWLPDDNLNKGKLEYFYWLLTLLQVVNLVY
ncbi:NRT1/ PTR family 3.1-like protein [Tanacetum coccineum]